MKRGILLLISLILFCTSSSAYNPPIYIANPVTMECKYYFEGDVNHVNPRPQNFTVTVGLTTQTSCELWYLCRNGTNPGIGWTQGKCVCDEGLAFNETVGCIPGLLNQERVMCEETFGIWEEEMPANFSCDTFCDNRYCRKVSCSWQKGCACPKGTILDANQGCTTLRNNSILTLIKDWFRNIGNRK